MSSLRKHWNPTRQRASFFEDIKYIPQSDNVSSSQRDSPLRQTRNIVSAHINSLKFIGSRPNSGNEYIHRGFPV